MAILKPTEACTPAPQLYLEYSMNLATLLVLIQIRWQGCIVNGLIKADRRESCQLKIIVEPLKN
jgi:hypothetical protein